MRYSIFYLIKGPAERYQQNLVKTIGPKFNERHLVENPLPAHITLKAPFESRDIRPIERALEKLVKTEKQSKAKIDGFGQFHNRVVFLNVVLSPGALKTQKRVIESLKKFKYIEIKETDENIHGHATISYGNTLENFNKIWKYTNTLDKPEFNLDFDNITIMRKSQGRWRVYREFKLK